MQSCNQQKVAENVDDTGNQNKQKRFLFPKITGNENCNSHCKLRYYKGDQIQYLDSGGNVIVKIPLSFFKIKNPLGMMGVNTHQSKRIYSVFIIF